MITTASSSVEIGWASIPRDDGMRGALQLVANVYGEFAVENQPRGICASAVVMEVW
jgi:hypothetical protein